MKTANGFELIDIEHIQDLELLKTKVMYSDVFQNLSKERQGEIYSFCLINVNNEACRENLKQIRYAVSKIYFGW